MKNQVFLAQSLDEKRAKLLSTLIKKSHGRLSKEELISILNSVDFSKQYTIVLCKSKDEFLHHAKLKDLIWVEKLQVGTWSEGILDSCVIAFGSLECGMIKAINGQTQEELDAKLSSDRACIITSTTSWGFDDDKIPTIKNKILIYLGT